MANNSLFKTSFLYAVSLSPLDREAEHELAVKMSKGDLKARELLIRSNIRFAITAAGHYSGFKLDYEDRVAVAITGLVKGVDHYQASRNTRVITCVAWWIRAEFKALCEKQEREVPVENCTEALEQFMQLQADEASISPEENAINSCLKDDFYKKVKTLPVEDRSIFLSYYGLDGHSKEDLATIGKRYGKTKQWAFLKVHSAKKYMAHQIQDWLA